MWFSTTFKGFLSSCMSFELVFKRKLSIYSTTAAAAAASERESSFDFGLYIFMFEWAFFSLRDVVLFPSIHHQCASSTEYQLMGDA